MLAVVLFIRRPRGATPMDRAIAEVEDALRRVGRPVSTGTTLRELERRLGSHSPEVAAYLRALSSGRYAADFEPPSRGGRRALRRALAQGLGFGGRLRALWAMPPRVERGWPRDAVADVGSRHVGARVAELSASARGSSAAPGEHTVGPRVKKLGAVAGWGSVTSRLTRGGRRALVRVSRLHRVRPGAGRCG